MAFVHLNSDSEPADSMYPSCASTLIATSLSYHCAPRPLDQETNLELGFPANIMHVITPSSPLFNLSLLEMDTRMMEVGGGQGVWVWV